ncbi:hypothetical protein D3C81_742780 [compost metagenome]
MQMPEKEITAWNGSASTPVRLCRSSRLRCNCLRGRKVKKSRKMRTCTITPDTIAASIAIAARPTSQ